LLATIGKSSGAPREAEDVIRRSLGIAFQGRRFKATAYAMNTLLIQKGVYTPQEFERLFAEWAKKQCEGTEASERLPATGS
jgi:hypothetical protein